MKEILMSIRPHWCELIASGKKTIDVRKTRPKIDTPFKVYIYETCERYMPWIDGTMTQEDARAFGICMKGGGKVIGEFVCDEIAKYLCGGSYMWYFDIYNGFCAPVDQMCLTQGDLFKYGKGETLYGWHISDLKIYDDPKPLNEFKRPCSWKSKICTGGCKRLVVDGNNDIRCADAIERAPQFWCYVEEIPTFDLEKPVDITASDKIKFVKFPPIPPLPPLI